MDPTRPSLSVVIPVYNSEATLGPALSRLEPVLRDQTSDFEVILVEDGSADASWSRIEELAAERPWVTGVRLMRNYGQHNALLCGIRRARKDVIVTLDDDLQNPPEEIPKLLAKLAEGFDVVYGTPLVEQHGFLRNLASIVTKFSLQAAMGVDMALKVSAFRAFRRQVCEAFGAYQSHFVSIDVLLTWGTSRFAAVDVQHDERTLGASNYTLGKLMSHALNMLTGFSTVPLQLASITGFAFTILGAVVLVYVVGRTLVEGVGVPGFAFLASIIAIFAGAQLFALGIIGEYLARMHFRMLERPAYNVRSTTSDPSEQP